MNLNRRSFLGVSTGAAAAAAGIGKAETPALSVGLIGCGWWGMIDLKSALQFPGTRASALCDVDSEHLAKAAAEVQSLQGDRPAAFKDYREMLAQVELDAVIIATPPHWHALPFIESCRRGVPVYCEKPLAYDIREGQAMVDAARASGQTVQIGFQRRQTKAIREAAEFIRAGSAGSIVQVEAQIHYEAKPGDTRVQDPPASLDWDLWCGPAPLLPYRPSIGHFNWRLEAAYGDGHLVDWGIHWIDTIRNVLGLEMPRRVHASGGNYRLRDQITTPDVLTVHYEFERCPLVWRHRIWGAAEPGAEFSNGIFFYGDRATVFAGDDRWVVMPRSQGGQPQVHAVKDDVAPVQRHVERFLAAIRSGGAVDCDAYDGFQSTATVQLAMISLRSGNALQWDGAACRIEGNDEASRLLKREYRSPWSHPYREA